VLPDLSACPSGVSLPGAIAFDLKGEGNDINKSVNY